uniref:Uncharacterized protein n=1 Tax=Helianthus annuus TaxID=4232 RepID=A0A251SFU9_HELAN
MVIICINTHFFKSVVFFCLVSVELVVEAVNLESASQPFEVVYHSRASTPEF